MPEYIKLTQAEWLACSHENGYKVVGSDEGGFSKDGPDGDTVFWSLDDDCAYRVVLTEDEQRHMRYLDHVYSGMSSFEARELSKYKNAPQPDVCPKCNQSDEIRESSGMVGETILYCHRCKQILWEDTVGAVKSVL